MRYDPNKEKFYVAILHTKVNGVDYFRPVSSYRPEFIARYPSRNGVIKRFGKPHEVFIYTAVEVPLRGEGGKKLSDTRAVLLRRHFQLHSPPSEETWYPIDSSVVRTGLEKVFPEQFLAKAS